MFHLFTYSLPNTIFFIIPIVFFTSCVLAISKLSFDYEMLVFFSLGIRPYDIIKSFLPLICIVCITSLVFSLGAVPVSKRAFDNFIERKKIDIDINIKAGEFGQKIGDWLVYVESAKDRVYNNLVLFSIGKKMLENFISAKQGQINNNQGVFELVLNEGQSYIAKDNEFKKILFQKAKIKTQVGEAPLSGYDLIEYWADAFNGNSHSKRRKFVKAVLISLFPILSIFLIPLIGIANPRYHKNLASIYIISSLVFYFTLVQILADSTPFGALTIIPPIWFLGSFLLYRYKIKPIY